MPTQCEFDDARARFRKAAELLEDARMVGAPPDCVAERLRDLAAARVGLLELGIDPESIDIPEDSNSHG